MATEQNPHLDRVFKRSFPVSAVKSYRISKKTVTGVGGRCQAGWCYFIGMRVDTFYPSAVPPICIRRSQERKSLNLHSVRKKRPLSQKGVHLAQQSELTNTFLMGPSPRVSREAAGTGLSQQGSTEII